MDDNNDTRARNQQTAWVASGIVQVLCQQTMMSFWNTSYRRICTKIILKTPLDHSRLVTRGGARQGVRDLPDELAFYFGNGLHRHHPPQIELIS